MAVASDLKNYEIRKEDDRKFAVGDVVVMSLTNPSEVFAFSDRGALA